MKSFQAKWFTLIEVLVAISVSAILMSGLIVMFGQILSYREDCATARTERLIQRKYTQIICRDLENLALPGGLFARPFTVSVDNDGDHRCDTLSYTAVVGVPDVAMAASGGLANVELRLEDDTAGGKNLVRGLQTNIYAPETQEDKTRVLLKNVTSLTCQTLTSNTWTDGWINTGDDLPDAVKLTIETADGKVATLLAARWVTPQNKSSISDTGTSQGETATP